MDALVIADGRWQIIRDFLAQECHFQQQLDLQAGRFNSFPGQKTGAALNHFENGHGDTLGVAFYKYDNVRRFNAQGSRGRRAEH